MEINIKNQTYYTAKIPKYNKLITKLNVLLQDNRNKREYHGIYNKGKIGILVYGTNSIGSSDFVKFFSINDINFYFTKHIERLKNHEKWRL